jgi:hypothetical protein
LTKNLAASVHQRLLNRARVEGRPFNELLQYFVMERFLYRLGHSPYQDQFVLKGALMLKVWGVPLPRPTRDIDLLGWMENEVVSIAAAVREICLTPVVEDGLSFSPETVAGERIVEAAEYHGVRVRLTAFLGNARIPMQIDVGFGDAVVPGPRAVRLPPLLEFPAAHLRGYSRESAIAEKLQIMVRLGEINSRMKDFFDLWLLAARAEFEGQILAAAIEATFQQRGTRIPASPVAFSDAFAGDPDRRVQWQAFLRRFRLSDEAAVPTQLRETVRLIAAFLGPILRAISAGEEFNAHWSPGGPWTPAK